MTAMDGKYFLGNVWDPKTGELTDETLRYDSEDLTTHAVVVGMTGSGKTGLPVGLLHEAPLNQVPALMIDPKGDGDNKDYFEIQINPQNLVFDSHFDDYNLPKGGPNGPFGHEAWSSEVKSAVTVRGTLDDDSDTDSGYTVEARFPWSAFEGSAKVPPEDGDVWRMNFYAMENNGGVAWSPIYGKGNFHKASRFGRVTFKR